MELIRSNGVLTSTEPMKVARSFAQDQFTTPKGRKGIWWVRGSWWVWEGGVWKVRGEEPVVSQLWTWLEDRSYEVANGFVRLGPDRKMVQDVYEALKAACYMSWIKFPVWVGREGPDPETCIAFRDKVVSVGGGKLEVVDRDEDWMDLVVLPVDWDPAARAERWEKAVEEWSEGDPKWGELLRRWMGYLLMAKRSYAKWLLMQGKSRGGKGVIAHVERRLIGQTAWVDVSQADLAGDFGLDGLEWARAINVPEVGKGGEEEKQASNRVMKSVIGEDPVTVNVKHQRQKRGVVIAAAIQMQANMIPRMPNESEGISSKMLVLPFTRTFKDKPQHDLKQVLDGELAGIAAWAVEGARRLEEEGGREWPEPEAAEDVRFRFRVANNPLDGFLESRCLQVPGGFVDGELLWREWEDFRKRNQIKLVIPRNQFALRLEEESTWQVKRGRRRVAGQNLRGVFGLGLRQRDSGESDSL